VLDIVSVSFTGSSPATSVLGPAQRVPIVVDGGTVGYAVMRLPKASQQSSAVAFRSDLVRRLLLGGIVAALLSLGLGLLFALRATAPVRRVQGAARALSAGDRSVRIATEGSDEFADVGRALRSMADSVEEQEQLRQSFAAGVAHELRTPLTILRSQVQGLRVGVLKPTPETIVSLEEEVIRISRLVADLQILGSADAAGFTLERISTDLRELVDETVREFAGLFEGTQVHLEARLEAVDAWIDRVRISQVVSNLLSNALKFTPPGGLVRVELRRDDPGPSFGSPTRVPASPPTSCGTSSTGSSGAAAQGQAARGSASPSSTSSFGPTGATSRAPATREAVPPSRSASRCSRNPPPTDSKRDLNSGSLPCLLERRR
jgi:signal transduction histidine kinase